MLTNRERVAALINEMSAMIDGAKAAGRDLSADEVKIYDAKAGEVDTLNAAIAREDKLASLKADAAAPAAPAAAEAVVPAAPVAAPAGPEASSEFETLGEFFAAVRFNENDQRLASLYNEPRAEQRFDTGSTGGFMIPKRFLPTLLEVSPQDAVVRPRATVIPAGSPADAEISMPALDQTGDAANAGMYGGVEVFKTAEGGQKPETAYKLREIKLQPAEVSAYMELTDKLLRNWGAASMFVERQFRAAMRGFEDLQFLRGNGVGGPLGILNSGARHVVTRDTNNTVKYADLVEMVARILTLGGTPVWVASRSLDAVLRQIKNETGGGGDGSLIWQENAVQGSPGSLMGYPVIWNQRSPAKNAEGDLVLADFNGYLIKDGSGPFVASSQHVKFRENKTAMKIFWNVDGQPWLTAPIKGEDDYDTSPFVVLGAGS